MDFAAKLALPSLIIAVSRVSREDGLDQAWLRDKVCRAFVVLADITDDNLNTCIEAGMGLAAGTNVELVARRRPRRPPFMLRDLQLPTYENEVDLLGLVNKIARRYRRRIFNAEM
jgi:hypothetical protein